MVLVDGQPADAVPVADRGLQYGDGLFETLEFEEGRPRRWQRHLDRLTEGCRRLRLHPPEPELLRAEVERVGAGHGRTVVKVILTRGQGGRGYAPPPDARPRRIVARHSWPGHPPELAAEGVAVRLCETRLGTSPALGGMKHLNRLEQVMARAEWDDPHIREGLMLDELGQPVEGTMSNLFAVVDHEVVTPPTTLRGVSGVMRGAVLDLARAEGLTAVVRPLGMDELLAADEAFLTNSLIHLWPIRELLGLRDFGHPGPVARWLREAIPRLP